MSDIPSRTTAPIQAFIAGFVDTVGFVGLFGLFTAHVTGNFVMLGASIAEARSGVVAKLVALPVFFLAVAGTSLFLRWCTARGRDPVGGVLAAQALFLTGFMGIAIGVGPFHHGDQPFAIAAGMLGVVAMAIQNAASRTIFSAFSPTTIMTGNSTQVVLDLVELTRGSGADPAARTRIAKMVPPLAAFIVGALAGGGGYVLVRFWALLVPILLILFLLLTRRTIVRPA